MWSQPTALKKEERRHFLIKGVIIWWKCVQNYFLFFVNSKELEQTYYDGKVKEVAEKQKDLINE